MTPVPLRLGWKSSRLTNGDVRRDAQAQPALRGIIHAALEQWLQTSAATSAPTAQFNGTVGMKNERVLRCFWSDAGLVLSFTQDQPHLEKKP